MKMNRVKKYGRLRDEIIRFLPRIVQSQENIDRVEYFKEIASTFIQLAEHAVRPVRYCNKKGRTNCRCCFRTIFGDSKQMGAVLAKTFEGEHRWIPAERGTSKIDAMFFSTTGEKLNDDPLAVVDYKEKPTFILCNPNAMFY